MRRFLLMLLASTFIAASPAMAMSHIETSSGTMIVFDDENEFWGHILTQTITDTLSKFSPKQTFSLQYKELLLDSQFIMSVGLPDMDLKLQAPLSILNSKFTGILFSAEWRF